MIIDDAAAIRRVADVILSDAGYRVHAADDGNDALEKLKGVPADLLICGMEMADMSGMDLVGKINRDKAYRLNRFIPIILLVKDSPRFMPDGPPTAEGITFLGKPFTPGELIESVRRRIGGP